MTLIEVDLHRLVGVDIEQREVDGVVQDCISIPIKPNGIKRGYRNTLKLYLGATRKNPNPLGQTHFLSVHFMSAEDYGRAMDLGYMDDQLKYVGNIRNYSRTPKKTSQKTKGNE